MSDVTSEWVELRTEDGPMRAYVARPGAAADRAVVVLQEAFGVNDHIQEVTRRLAKRDFLAVAPDLFHRTGPEVIPYPDHAEAVALISQLGVQEIGVDVGATLRFLGDSEQIGLDRTAVVGFCFGGRASFTAATLTPGLAAAVVFYGPGISTGPHAVLDRAGDLTAPVLMHVGSEDPTISTTDLDAIRAAVGRSTADLTQHVYDGAGHAFACDARPNMHDAGAATTAWERTYEFLHQHLPGPALTTSTTQEPA